MKDSYEIERVLQTSRINNASQQITGILLCNLNNCLQYIEGTKSEIDKLFEKILKDRRHYNVVKVAEAHMTQRRFGRWDMGFFIARENQFDFLPSCWTTLNEVQALNVINIAEQAHQNDNMDIFYRLG